MGSFWFALSQEDIYASSKPESGFARLLETVGNSLAEDIGLPKPGSVEEATDTIIGVKEWILDETAEYGLRERYWKLRDRVVKEGMGIAFESYSEKETTRKGVTWGAS